MTTEPNVRVRRIYDETGDQDGARVLVDRRWPRGADEAIADLDEWCKGVATSTTLRKWYDHDPAKFAEFSRRYLVDLEEPEGAKVLQHLRQLDDGYRLTLLTAVPTEAGSEQHRPIRPASCSYRVTTPSVMTGSTRSPRVDRLCVRS